MTTKKARDKMKELKTAMEAMEVEVVVEVDVAL